MSVLIKGMEMPDSCRKCELFINCDDCEGRETNCAILGNIGYLHEIPNDFRHSNCPLVEVSVPHGRLIDADALHYNRVQIVHGGLVGGYNAVVMSAEIKDAHTIIEAEGKDDGRSNQGMEHEG